MYRAGSVGGTVQGPVGGPEVFLGVKKILPEIRRYDAPFEVPEGDRREAHVLGGVVRCYDARSGGTPLAGCSSSPACTGL